MKNKEADTQKKKKIFLVEDHPLVQKGLIHLIESENDLCVCGGAVDGTEAIRTIAVLEPDLLIVDISLKGNNGIELIKTVKRLYGDTLPMLVLSLHSEAVFAPRALRAGALAYIQKEDSADKIITAIRRILAGGIYVSSKVESLMLQQVAKGYHNRSPIDKLSDRELEIILLIGEGRSTRGIAEYLNISIKTIESHRAHIKEKLELKNATELIQFSVQWVEQENRVHLTAKKEPNQTARLTNTMANEA